jgi:hypothetical protein
MTIKARCLIVEVVIQLQLRKYSLWKFQQHYALPGEVPAVGELSTRQFDSELHLQAKYVFITCIHLKQTFLYDVCRSYSNFDMTSADDWCDQNLRAVNLDFKNSFCSHKSQSWDDLSFWTFQTNHGVLGIRLFTILQIKVSVAFLI